MQITAHIELPIFKCRSDEDIFFGRLSEIDGLEKIHPDPNRITLTISTQNLDDTTAQLQVICDIWHCTFHITSK